MKSPPANLSPHQPILLTLQQIERARRRKRVDATSEGRNDQRVRSNSEVPTCPLTLE
jgi:hypothetical protein